MDRQRANKESPRQTGRGLKIMVPCERSRHNTHVQYETPIICGRKVMAKVKVFQK